MCGLCLFLGAGLHDCEKEKNSLQLNRQRFCPCTRQNWFWVFSFFSVSIMVQRLCLTKVSANEYWKISLVSLLSLFFHSIPQFSEAQM